MAATIAWPCCSSRALMVKSRMMMSFTSSTRSTARMSPPASPMAEVRRPSIPGRFLIAARRVRLYEALGVRAMDLKLAS